MHYLPRVNILHIPISINDSMAAVWVARRTKTCNVVAVLGGTVIRHIPADMYVRGELIAFALHTICAVYTAAISISFTRLIPRRNLVFALVLYEEH